MTIVLVHLTCCRSVEHIVEWGEERETVMGEGVCYKS